MADIRHSGLLDDFERAAENPILPPWYNPFLGVYGDMQILSGGGAGTISGTVLPPTGNACWRPDVAASSDVEIWGIASGSAAIPDSFRIGLFTRDQPVYGYQCVPGLGVGGSNWDMRRYDGGGGSTFTSLQFTAHAMPADGSLVLLRTYGVRVQSWLSNDSGVTWTMVNDVSDNTYRVGLHPMLGITTGFGGGAYEIGWKGVGFGQVNRQHIYRWLRA